MPPTPWTPGNYPPTRRSDHVDVYKSALKGEVHVSDPYQWLEENSDEVDNWTTAQAAFTQAYLDQNADMQKLEDKFRASMDYAKVINWPLPYISSSCLKPFPVVLCAHST
jgi:prolyl oligopeptidase